MRVKLCNILYHMDLESLFFVTGDLARADHSIKMQRERQAMKATGVRPNTRVTFDGVVRKVMTEHLQVRIAAPGAIFSVPKHILGAESLQSFSETPAAKRLKAAGGRPVPAIEDADAVDPLPQLLDIDACDQVPTDNDEVFFTTILNRAGDKRHMPMAVGAGSNLRKLNSAVTVHELIWMSDSGSEAFIFCESKSSADCTSHIIGDM